MGNIIDYAREERHSFEELPFNEVDALVLAQLAYEDIPTLVPDLDDEQKTYGTPLARLRNFRLDRRHVGRSVKALFRTPFSPITLKQMDEVLHGGADIACQHQVHAVNFTDPAITHSFVRTVADNPRFSGLRVGAFAERFDAEEQTQTAALTFLLPDGTLVLSFRGTDDSLVGWKEDFNMSVRCPVPSQTQAVEYFRSIEERTSSPFAAAPRIHVGGHSKGGNLAVYTAMKAKSEHIGRVFSHDGPGFMREVTASEDFRAIEPIVEKTVPEASVIGMLMSTVNEYTIVETNVSGIMQHMGLNWRIEDGDFITKPELSPKARLLDRTLDAWMEQFTDRERAQAVDQCYDIIASAGYRVIPPNLRIISATRCPSSPRRSDRPYEVDAQPHHQHPQSASRHGRAIAVRTVQPLRRTGREIHGGRRR